MFFNTTQASAMIFMHRQRIGTFAAGPTATLDLRRQGRADLCRLCQLEK
jgi:hypothetical protein